MGIAGGEEGDGAESAGAVDVGGADGVKELDI